ncbi:MAG: hypothetical protein K8F31_05800 [Roseovarius sp.]|nr:hypothetical protein [Roseovarius sp.]
MKRLYSILSFAAMASLLMTSNAWAGIDYIRYREEFLGRSSGKRPSEDNKPRQRQSKPEEESKEPTVTPSPQEKETRKPAKNSP